MPTLTIKVPGGRVGHFIAGAAVASVIGGTALAVTEANFTYSTTKNGYVSIDAAAMVPSNDTTAADYRIFPGFHAESPIEPEGCFATGINLPQGSKLRSVTTFFRSSNQSDPVVVLRRKNMQSRATAKMVEVQYFDNSGVGVQRTTAIAAALATIDNSRFAYSYSVCLSGGTAFEGARLDYTFKTAVD